jgi:hypothetical protein
MAEIGFNHIEYLTQSVFKANGKPETRLQRSIKAFIKKFSGVDNLFLGNQEYTFPELWNAYHADKAATALKYEAKLNEGFKDMAVDFGVSEYGCDRAKLIECMEALRVFA